MKLTTKEIARFRSYVVISPNGCWDWNGSRRARGYGQLSIRRNGKATPMLAHRLSWMIHYGPVPDGVCVCHGCDRPPCVNPKHLWLGSQRENMRNAAWKGRLHRAPARTWTPIWDIIDQRGMTLSDVATRCGVSRERVRQWRQRGASWGTMQRVADAYQIDVSVNAVPK